MDKLNGCQSALERQMYAIGKFVGTYPYASLFLNLFILILCMIGNKNITIEENIVKLWIERGSRLGPEMDYLMDNFAPNLERGEILQMHGDGEDVANFEYLEAHYNQIRYVVGNAEYTHDYLDYDWWSMCSRDYLEGLPMPCKYWSPMQCFKEGGMDIAYADDWWLMFQDALRAGAKIPNAYLTKPSFMWQTDRKNHADVGNLYCNGWSTDVFIVEAGYAGEIKHSKGPLWMNMLDGANDARTFFNDGSVDKSEPYQVVAIETIMSVNMGVAWERHLMNEVETFLDANGDPVEKEAFKFECGAVMTDNVDTTPEITIATGYQCIDFNPTTISLPWVPVGTVGTSDVAYDLCIQACKDNRQNRVVSGCCQYWEGKCYLNEETPSVGPTGDLYQAQYAAGMVATDGVITYDEINDWYKADIPNNFVPDQPLNYLDAGWVREQIIKTMAYSRIVQEVAYRALDAYDPKNEPWNNLIDARMNFTQAISVEAWQTILNIQSENGLASLIGGCLDEDGTVCTGVTGTCPGGVLTQKYIDSLGRGFRDENGELLFMDKTEYRCYKDPSELTNAQEDYALDILEGWEESFLDLANKAQDMNPEGATLDRFSARTAKDIQIMAGAANGSLIILGYLILIVMVSVSLASFQSAWRSRIAVGLGGILLIVLCVSAGFGFWSWLGWRITPSQLQILPLLGLGLGADNVFVMVMNMKNVKGMDPAEIVAESFRTTMSSVYLTGLCNIVCFTCGCVVPLPQLQYFAGCAIVIVCFNLISITLGLGALLTLDLRRQNSGKADCFCCMSAEPSYQEISTEKSDPPHETDNNITWLYSKILTIPGAIIIICSVLILFITGCVGVTKLLVGLPSWKQIPESHYAASFLKARENYFYVFPLLSIVGERGYKGGKSETWDFPLPESMAIMTYSVMPEMDQRLHFVHDLIGFDTANWIKTLLKHAHYDEKIVYKAPYYMTEETPYACMNLQEENAAYVDVADIPDALLKCQEITTMVDGVLKKTPCVQFLYKDGAQPQYKPCTYIYEHDAEAIFWRNWQLPWVIKNNKDIGAVTIIPADMIDPNELDAYVENWLTTEEGAPYGSLVAWDTSVEPRRLKSYFTIGLLNLDYIWPDWKVTMVDSRDVMDTMSKWQGMDGFQAPAYVYSFGFNVFEQFLSLPRYLNISIIIAIVALFFLLSLFLMDLKGPLAITISIVLVTFEVWGFCHWSGLALNGVMALNLIVSLGIGVEFNAHVARFYQLQPNARCRDAKDRIILTMEALFAPISLAAISTLLGVFPVVFAAFPYFRLYFFTLYFFIIGFAFIHALFFLPVLLWILQPRFSDDTTTDGLPLKQAAPKIESTNELVEVQGSKRVPSTSDSEGGGDKMQTGGSSYE